MTASRLRVLDLGTTAAILGLGLLTITLLLPLGCTTESPGSTFSQPPPLATPSGTTSGKPLLQGSLVGWQLEGDARFASDNLEIGGQVKTSLSFDTTIPPGSKLSFDFFQEGRGKSEFLVSPVSPGAVSKFAMPLKLDFDQSEFVYKRWYHCEVTTSHGDGHAELDAKVTVLSGSLGKEGDYDRHFPSDSNIRFRLSFDIAAGSKLYVRNMFLVTP